MIKPHARAPRRHPGLLCALLIAVVSAASADPGAAHEDSTPVETHADHDHEQPHTQGSDHDHDAAAEAQHSGSTQGDQGHHPHEEPGPEAHDHRHDPGSEPPEAIRLTPAQRRTLGLRVEPLSARVHGEGLRAPGEVQLNAYATAQVTPRIAAQVIARHARLGDQVTRGQPLVTLSSVEMAEAQGDLVVAELEWGRLDKIKDKFVSDREYLEASVARQKARSRALAYGMTEVQIAALLTGATRRADGTFELLAPQDGTIIQDAFIQGELVQPGRVLFEITDEQVRWVEARLAPGEAARVSIGDTARVSAGQDAHWLDGQVVQIHHLLDEGTRTQAVRVAVPDPDHRLHPGVFVDVIVQLAGGESILSVPETAVLRAPDGDWQVFVSEGEDLFRPVEVELVRTTDGLAVIQGLAPGTQVVTSGAFFLRSELAKGGFDPHNH